MADVRDSFIRRLFLDAGIAPGMRVLDIGCGRGDVTRLLGELVGPSGEAVGLDRDARALELARAQIPTAESAPLRYVEAELDDCAFEAEAFDAITCRRVLMYLPRPVEVLRHVCVCLREGGLFVVQEQDTTMVPASLAALPLHRKVHGWMWETVEREGADVHIGFHLAQRLEDAGLIVEELRGEAVIQTPQRFHDVVRIIEAMLPRIEARGVATREEIAIETLAQRLAEEREQAQAIYIGDMVFGAWARKP